MDENKKAGAIKEIGPEDAFLIFEKWNSEEATVLCSGSFFGWSLSLRGEIAEVSRREVSFALRDDLGVVTLLLDEKDLVFRYGEPKDAPLPVPEEAKDLSALVVSLPLRVTPSVAQLAVEGKLKESPPREKLIFMELPRAK